MHLNAKPPVFIPDEYQAEIEKLSKAALMDMVWDYATQISETPLSDTMIMEEFRRRREIILHHRKSTKSPLKQIREARAQELAGREKCSS